MSAGQELNAAVIGLGIGRQHLIGYEKTPWCRPRFACDLSSDKLTEIQQEFPSVRCMDRWEELIEQDDLDVVSIASFDDAHCEQVGRFLGAGIHVFVEKPLCLNRDELASIKRHWQSTSRCWLASNLVLRSAPLYRWLFDLVRSGGLGTIYAIDGDYLYGRLHKIVDGWRSEIDGYSVMMGGGIHMADLMLWLVGERPTTVRATGNSICTRETRFRYNDFVNATYHFPSGVIGRITANFGCVHRHQHVLRVFGTKATFIYDDQGARIIRGRDPDGTSERVAHSPLPSNKWDLIPSFIERIKGHDDPAAQAEQEFDLVSLCLAADESIALNEEIEIEYA